MVHVLGLGVTLFGQQPVIVDDDSRLSLKRSNLSDRTTSFVSMMWPHHLKTVDGRRHPHPR